MRLRPELVHFTAAQNEAYFRKVTERLENTPGVQSVAMVQGGQGLIWQWESGREIQVDLPGQAPSTTETRGVLHHDVSAYFFETLGIPLLQGRAFTEQDGIDAPPVAIVNQTLATRLWPHESAIGQKVIIKGQPWRVVGVSANIQPPSSVQAPEPYLFLPFWQSSPGKNGDIRLAVRLTGNPAAELPRLRQVVRALDPDIPLSEDMPLTEQVGITYMPVLLARTVMGYTGLLALCLSAIGLYSVLAFSIRSRTREIGLRLALGARPQQVVQLVLREGLRLSGIGLAVGIVAARVTTRLLASWLFGVHSLDLFSYVAAIILLLAAALTASYLPSRHASRVDPIIALRYE
jgi:predicted permease